MPNDMAGRTGTVQSIGGPDTKVESGSCRSLDPRTKLLILVLVNIISFYRTDFYTGTACIALICAAMLYHRRYAGCVRAAAAYALLLLLTAAAVQLRNPLIAMLSVVFLLAFKMLPIVLVASLLISSTRVGEMLAALQKMRVPKSIVIPLAVTMRFFPTIREEFSHILEAMKVRGIRLSAENILLHPLLLTERILVPMMLHLSAVAEELSAAAVTRGIDAPKPRTSYYEVRFAAMDAVFLLLFAVLAVIALFHL